MPLIGEYEPSPEKAVRNQVAAYEASGGTDGNVLPGTTAPVVIVTSLGARTGRLRKTPLMRVEHRGRYALIGSQGGAPKHPTWYFNLLADPRIELQDGADPRDMVVRVLVDEERNKWWQRAVETFPDFEEYQARTAREIPVLLAEPSQNDH